MSGNMTDNTAPNDQKNPISNIIYFFVYIAMIPRYKVSPQTPSGIECSQFHIPFPAVQAYNANSSNKANVAIEYLTRFSYL